MRFKLTRASKILIAVLIIVTIAGGIYTGISKGLIVPKKKTTNGNTTVTKEAETTTKTSNENTSTGEENTINLSLDEWIGYATIIQANGGLTTKKGSIYDNLGLNVNINIINDATQSSNALIQGTIDAAGYTVNRLAFLSNKFAESGTNITVPYITNYSNGGDGIIAKKTITSISDLVGAKIGVPQFSESQAMLVWFVNQSDLTQAEKDDIINNLILFETADEAAKAFFAGEIDVAGTWQPYLSQAESMTDSHILFSTASSSKLIMSSVVFRKDFAENNPELVSTFIDGTLQAISLYDKEFDDLKESMPMFSGMTDEDIKGMTYDASLATWQNNVDIFSDGDAKLIYQNMCDIWTSIGETVNLDNIDTLFDSSYVLSLKDKYETNIVQDEAGDEIAVVTEENKQEILDTEALLSKSTSVSFVINTAKFSDSAAATAALDSFIGIAKVLDGAIIEIAGNTDPNPYSDPTDQANILLSEQRADTVKQYFVMNGINANRIITVGNGSSNPIVDNDTEENRAMNRRTDISFKIIE